VEKRPGMDSHDSRHHVPTSRVRRGNIPDATRLVQLGSNYRAPKSDRRSWSKFLGDGNDEISGTERTILPNWYHFGILAISIGLILILLAIGSGV
jgi:hypothetical protein